MRRLTALVLACVVLAGCGTNRFVKNTYGTLATFAAAYSVEEPARESFCKGKVPQPAACVSAYEAAAIGWAAFVEGSELLAVFIETKDETTKARLVRLVPELIGSAVELQKAIQELKRQNTNARMFLGTVEDPNHMVEVR